MLKYPVGHIEILKCVFPLAWLIRLAAMCDSDGTLRLDQHLVLVVFVSHTATRVNHGSVEYQLSGVWLGPLALRDVGDIDTTL